MIEVFLTNQRRYNEGAVFGKWITLPIEDEDDLYAEIRAIVNFNDDYFISDYKAPFSISENESIYNLNNWLNCISEYNVDINVAALLEKNLGRNETLNVIESDNYRIYNAISMEEVAYEFITHTNPQWSELDEIFKRHFDFISYGEELEANGTFLKDTTNKIIIEIY